MLLLWITTDLATPWLYRGGLPVFGLLSAVVVTAAVAPSGPVRAVLSIKPLAWLGLISYGVYLFHWPIYLWLTTDRTGLSQVPLFALRFTVTVAAATASYLLVEQPVRLRRVLTDNRRAILTASAVASVTIIWLATITATLPAAPIDFEQAAADAAALTAGSADVDSRSSLRRRQPRTPPNRYTATNRRRRRLHGPHGGGWARMMGTLQQHGRHRAGRATPSLAASAAVETEYSRP